MFSFLKQDLKILASFLLVEENTEDKWSWISYYPMYCPKWLIYIKTNLYLHLPHLLLKNFFDMKVKLEVLPVFPIYIYIYDLNQHWIGKHPAQFCPDRLIYIEALSWELFV